MSDACCERRAMNFVIAPDIFALFPGLRLVVAVAYGVDNATARPAVDAEWTAAWSAASAAAAAYGNAQSHPRIVPWRERWRAMGVSSKAFPTSIENIVRRALKGGEPFRINPLVDFYNAVSLAHVVPAGGFDLADIRGPLELRLSRDGDTFIALGEEDAVAVPPGEVTYADGATVLTRHFVWRQARTGLITAATRDVFLVSELLGEVGVAVADAVAADFETGLSTFFGVRPHLALLDADHSQLDLGK